MLTQAKQQEIVKLLSQELALIEQLLPPEVRQYKARGQYKCGKGYNCGGSCINRGYGCRKALDGEAKNFGEYMVAKMSANMGAALGEKPAPEAPAKPKPAERKIKKLTDKEIDKLKPTKAVFEEDYRYAPGGKRSHDYEVFNDQAAVKDTRSVGRNGKKQSSSFHGNFKVDLIDESGKPVGIPAGRASKSESSRESQLGIFNTKRSARAAAKDLIKAGITVEYIKSIKDDKAALTAAQQKIREVFVKNGDSYLRGYAARHYKARGQYNPPHRLHRIAPPNHYPQSPCNQ